MRASMGRLMANRFNAMAMTGSSLMSSCAESFGRRALGSSTWTGRLGAGGVIGRFSSTSSAAQAEDTQGAGDGSKNTSGSSANPFEFHTHFQQRQKPKRWFFPHGKWKRVYDPDKHIMRGWGSREKVKRMPPHQKGCIVKTVHHIRIAPRKLNRVCTMIRKRSLEQAQAQLSCSILKGAHIISTVLKPAIEEAEENKWDMKRVRVAELVVGRGIRVKQLRPWHGKGRFGIGTKYRAHLTVVLEQLPEKVFKKLYLTKPRPSYTRLPDHMRKPKAILPPPELMPKPWLIRSQMDINVLS